MLQMGSSRPWPDALEVLTGQRNMDAGALLEYFRPLQDFLENYNKNNGVYVGWEQPRQGNSYNIYKEMVIILYFSVCVGSKKEKDATA